MSVPKQLSYWCCTVIRELAVENNPWIGTSLAGGACGVLLVYLTREAAEADNPGMPVIEVVWRGTTDDLKEATG